MSWSFSPLHPSLLCRYFPGTANQRFSRWRGFWLAVATPPADSDIISLSSLVTWSVSWSSAHPPDPLLFTNQHTVRNSRMRTSAWSDQVPEPHCTPRRVRGDSVPLPILILPRVLVCVCTCALRVSLVLEQLWVGSRNRPVDRFGYNLLTSKLTSY